jgi:hypothetical protein
VSSRVVVVGSYAPIPVPGAAASRAEVQRAWADGSEVTVVAPRLCAAHVTVPVAGLLAGRRLANVGRVTGSRRLVLVVEEGYPFSRPTPFLQAVTAILLIRAFRSFDHVRLVRAGAVGLTPAVWSRLARAASETVDVEAPSAAPGVTPLGPPEEPPAVRARRMARSAATRVLGSRAPAVRARLGRYRRRLRR